MASCIDSIFKFGIDRCYWDCSTTVVVMPSSEESVRPLPERDLARNLQTLDDLEYPFETETRRVYRSQLDANPNDIRRAIFNVAAKNVKLLCPERRAGRKLEGIARLKLASAISGVNLEQKYNLSKPLDPGEVKQLNKQVIRITKVGSQAAKLWKAFIHSAPSSLEDLEKMKEEQVITKKQLSIFKDALKKAQKAAFEKFIGVVSFFDALSRERFCDLTLEHQIMFIQAAEKCPDQFLDSSFTFWSEGRRLSERIIPNLFEALRFNTMPVEAAANAAEAAQYSSIDTVWDCSGMGGREMSSPAHLIPPVEKEEEEGIVAVAASAERAVPAAAEVTHVDLSEVLSKNGKKLLDKITKSSGATMETKALGLVILEVVSSLHELDVNKLNKINSLTKSEFKQFEKAVDDFILHIGTIFYLYKAFKETSHLKNNEKIKALTIKEGYGFSIPVFKTFKTLTDSRRAHFFKRIEESQCLAKLSPLLLKILYQVANEFSWNAKSRFNQIYNLSTWIREESQAFQPFNLPENEREEAAGAGGKEFEEIAL